MVNDPLAETIREKWGILFHHIWVGTPVYTGRIASKNHTSVPAEPTILAVIDSIPLDRNQIINELQGPNHIMGSAFYIDSQHLCLVWAPSCIYAPDSS